MKDRDRPVASIGLRAHSGWAALVAVSATPGSIDLLARRRIEIADPAISGSKQPYHEAEEMPLAKAAKYLEKCERGADRLAEEAFRGVLDELARERRVPQVCALLEASGRALPDLPAILGSHALIHTADGEHFRAALARASEGFRLPVFRVREKEVLEKASSALGIPGPDLQRRVNELGRSAGPPWTADQKLAALAAWLAAVAGP